MTSKSSPRSLTSSAPASSTAASTSSSVTPPALGTMHDALAAEQVRHAARVGERAAVAGQRDADLGGGAVAVVGQALDEYRDAARPVALVGDRLVVGAAGVDARPAAYRAVDVVVGHRVALGLGDRVGEGRVAGHVTAAGAGRDLDVLDQLGEQLAAPGIDDGLLVLRRRPFGMAAHVARSLTIVDEHLVDPRVAGQLGVKRRRQQRSLPHRHDLIRGPGQHLDLVADLLAHGARMKTASNSPTPSTVTEPSNESTWRPKALRRTVMSMPPRPTWSGGASSTRSASRIIPAHDPYAGSPAFSAARSGSSTLERHEQLADRGRLAAGHDDPVDPVEVAWAPHRRPARHRPTCSAATCSRTSPCRARTPIRGMSEGRSVEFVRARRATSRAARAGGRPAVPRR